MTNIKLKNIIDYLDRVYQALLREGLVYGSYLRLRKLLYFLDGISGLHFLQLRKILNKNSKIEKKIIFSPTISWEAPLPQRSQHLAWHLVKRNNLCFYCLAFPEEDQIVGFKRINQQLYLTNSHAFILRKLNQFIYFINNSNPPSISEKFINKLLANKKVILVYDYLDKYHPQIYQDQAWLKKNTQRHHFLIKKADIIFCTASQLYDEVKKERQKDLYLVENAADYQHFHINKPEFLPERLKLIDKKKPIVGYFGALAQWLDYDLLNYVAKEKKEINFVFLGFDYDKSIKKLNKSPNIHYLGNISYQELPDYAIWFDVAIIPFKTDMVGQTTSPIKLFEYMALGKPIVATDITECRKYKSVIIAKNKKEFLRLIDRGLVLAKDQKYLSLLDKEAQENTWDKRTSEINKIIKNKILEKWQKK